MPGKLLCGLVALMILALAPVAGARDGANLESRITERIEAETACRVDYISQLRDLRSATPPRVEARVHCRDGDAYDIDWQLRPDRFRFRPCVEARAVC